MKSKVAFIGVLIVVLVAVLGVELVKVDAGANSNSATGVVNIRKVLQTCNRSQQYREEAQAAETKIMDELNGLRNEIMAAESALNTVKQGTTDYLKSEEDLNTKKASFTSKQKYYQQKYATQDLEWTQKIYQDILKAVGEVAKTKGLNVVLEQNKPEFPVESLEQLMMVISDLKVLYSEGAVDITDDVITKIDAMK